jgi:hypothetical protein
MCMHILIKLIKYNEENNNLQLDWKDFLENMNEGFFVETSK